MGGERILRELGYVHYLDCDGGFIAIDITPNAPNCALLLNKCSLLCQLYLS